MGDVRKIVCFGDSNTWGACGFTAARRDKDRRWCGILDMEDDLEVINCGENGRSIPDDKWALRAFEAMTAKEAPFDLLIVMLGTNDLLTMSLPDADIVAERMERFLKTVLDDPAIVGDTSKILLTAPPQTEIGRAYEDACFDEASAKLGKNYAALAKRLGVNFADASGWGVELGPDGVHFTEEGHRAFAKGLKKELWSIFPELAAGSSS